MVTKKDTTPALLAPIPNPWASSFRTGLTCNNILYYIIYIHS